MALNLEIVGKPIKSDPFHYGPDQVILYALGIGAGPKDIEFVYENGLKVYPSFAVVPFLPAFFGPFMKQVNITLAGVLHGEHKIIQHRPIPDAGTLVSTLYCDSIHDKGDKGAVINVRVETHTGDGELLFENLAKVFDRTGGNFGGERGPESDTHDPPDGVDPDFKIAYATAANQAALYRLSGDKNPLHIDLPPGEPVPIHARNRWSLEAQGRLGLLGTLPGPPIVHANAPDQEDPATTEPDAGG